ncbi:MAG: hypothetical protein K6C13_09045 [Oscillospiraceae bacterium]|nr:hypothetical protein [Oscillospiraceae bacterium]
MVKYTIDDELSKATDSYKITVTAGESKPVVKATYKNGYIILTWKPVDGADKYTVYRYEKGKLRKIKATKKTSVRIKATSGKEYKFAVKAYVNDKWTTVKKTDIVTVTAE